MIPPVSYIRKILTKETARSSLCFSKAFIVSVVILHPVGNFANSIPIERLVDHMDAQQQTGTQTHPQTGPEVTITVDAQTRTIHRGSYVVSQLKADLQIDSSRVLEQIVGGEFKPLDDSARITIKGDEIFVSHARSGGSSHE